MPITCPVCGGTSYNPADVREGYCGFCHGWTSLPAALGNEPGPELENSMTESAPEQVEQDEQTIEPREVTDENPIVEGEVPEGLEVVATDVVVSSDDPELPELVVPDEDSEDPEEYGPTDEEMEAHLKEKYPPHELDLPPAAEDVPAPHAPYDPSHGAR